MGGGAQSDAGGWPLRAAASIPVPILQAPLAPPHPCTRRHFGKGQTEADLDLAPGKHRLQLQFADATHKSYGEKWATTVEVTIKP